MALYKFFQSTMAAMVGFFMSAYVLLKYQLIALVILAVISTITFAMVEWRHHVSNQKCEDSLTNISYDEEPYSGGSRGGPGRARPPLKSCPPFYYLHLTRHTVTSGSLLDRHNARASRSKCLKSASDRRSCLARECARNENNKIDRF